jgi:hypothetical protein
VAVPGQDAAAGSEGVPRLQVQRAQILVHFTADALQEMRFVWLIHRLKINGLTLSDLRFVQCKSSFRRQQS